MPTPYPIVIAGARAIIMRSVIELSKPECEPLHAVLSTKAGATDIPAILRGEKPTSSDPEAAEFGSHDYSKRPVAIIVGGGYGEEDVKVMRDACEGCLNVPWLLNDKSKATGVEPGPEYANVIMGRVKELLKKLEDEGKFGKDGVYYY